MILTKVDYQLHAAEGEQWSIKDVNLGKINLITGLNATGKTRLAGLISNMARTLAGQTTSPKDGKWVLEFKDPGAKQSYTYRLHVENKHILQEELFEDNVSLLKRREGAGEIFSCVQDKMVSFNPPPERLTPHVRRDVKEFPFLEALLTWAHDFFAYTFTDTAPNPVRNRPGREPLMENLGTTPYLLVEALKKPGVRESIIKEFSSIGYPVEKVDVKPVDIPGMSPPPLLSVVREKDLSHATGQDTMSQGMYRAFSLIVILEYLVRADIRCTLVIDDLGEGLDFRKAAAITKLLLEKLRDSKVQLIATSNERTIINGVPLEVLNILERDGHRVRSYNVLNSKEYFEEFKITGLTNFDFFSGGMYKSGE